MWANLTEDGLEDHRMIHRGMAPLRGVKYAVNCFFNSRRIRAIERGEIEG